MSAAKQATPAQVDFLAASFILNATSDTSLKRARNSQAIDAKFNPVLYSLRYFAGAIDEQPALTKTEIQQLYTEVFAPHAHPANPTLRFAGKRQPEFSLSVV